MSRLLTTVKFKKSITAGLIGGMALTMAPIPATYAQSSPLQATPLVQPIEVSGTTSNVEQASCGYFSEAPTQTLRVTEPFASFTIEVNGEGALTLLIQGPDDFSECLTTDRFTAGHIESPGLLNQGDYDIYVGSKAGEDLSFTLSIAQD